MIHLDACTCRWVGGPFVHPLTFRSALEENEWMHGGWQSGHSVHARPFIMVATWFCEAACPAILHALMGGCACMHAWPRCVHALAILDKNGGCHGDNADMHAHASTAHSLTD